MHAHGSSPDPKSRRDQLIIEPALNRLMQLGCPIYPAVTPDPVNARALAPVGTDGSVWCGNLVWLQK
jgi:hypothetical protein